MKNKRNVILILAFLLLGAALLLATYGRKQNENEVIVKVDGQVVKTFALKDTITYKIEASNGNNLLRIEQGSVWLEEADCPDGICVNTGKIKYAGQTIVCLPHKVVISIREK